MMPHLPAGAGSDDLRCQGFAVTHYSITLDALDLQHPQLLQRQGYVSACFVINEQSGSKHSPQQLRETRQ
jgi:hypothetical protein